MASSKGTRTCSRNKNEDALLDGDDEVSLDDKDSAHDVLEDYDERFKMIYINDPEELNKKIIEAVCKVCEIDSNALYVNVAIRDLVHNIGIVLN